MDYSDDAISAHPARCNRKISNKWTKEEDQRLLELISQHDMTDTKKGKIWTQVSEGLAPRTAKQCRERYVNNIDPNRKKGNWTAEEDEIIFKLVDDLGTKWSKISALLPGRTDNDVKNRYHTKNEQSPFHPSQYYAKKRKPEGTPASNNPKKKPRISIKLSSTPSTEKKVESKSDDPTYFPNKLMNILESADPSIISWVADGDAFIIRDKDRFANSICPQYFKHSKFRAFQRSLSQYGFRRISDGDNKGAYQHEKFKRDQPWLSAQMKSMPRDDRMKKSDAIKSIRDSFNTPGGIDPQIGMRVQVKYMGVAQGGVIEHVYKHPHAPFWNLTIRFDNGERGENVYPGQFIKLIPKKSQITPIHFGSDAASKQEYPSKTSNLNESEVALCHELIGMAKSSSSDDMSKSSAPDTDREELKNQCSGEEQEEEEEEEYEDYLYEYLAMKAKGEFDSVHQKESDAQESSSEQQESTDDESGSYNPAGGDAIDLLSGKIFNSTTKQRAKKEKKKRDEDEFKDTCNIEGCKNTAQRGGRCIKHGGKYISKKERARLGLDVNTKRNRRPSLKVKANQGGDNTGLYSETRRRQAHSIHDGQPENKAEGIADVGPHDVLVGRGGLTNHNPGNIKWRNIVEILKPEYKAASRANKAHIAMSIVKEWRRLEPSGRFLKRDDETGLWSDIGDVDARIKCSQVLRENKGTKLKLDEFGYSCGGKNSAPDLSTVIGRSPETLGRSSLDSHQSSTKSDSDMKPHYSSDHSPDSSTYTMEDEPPSHNYGSRSRTSGFRKKYEEGPDSDAEWSDDMPALDLSKPKSTKKVKNKYLMSGDPIKSKKASASKKKKKKPINKRMEVTLIGDADDPTLQDVLLGRGGGTNGHPGNARFRDESRKLRSVYEASAREDKKQISLDLVDTVHAYGGRFMRQEQDGKWYEVDHESARKKCSQALRENKWN